MAKPSEEVDVNPIVRGRLCTCGQPAPNGLSLHPECAVEDLAARVRARSGAEVAREQRQRDAELTTAAAVAKKLEAARWTAALRSKIEEYRQVCQRATTRQGMEAAAQRAAALEEVLEAMAGNASEGGGE